MSQDRYQYLEELDREIRERARTMTIYEFFEAIMIGEISRNDLIMLQHYRNMRKYKTIVEESRKRLNRAIETHKSNIEVQARRQLEEAQRMLVVNRNRLDELSKKNV